MTTDVKLAFTSEDLKGQQFKFDSLTSNGRSKILLLIDAQVDQSSIALLQEWAAFITKMTTDYVSIPQGIELIPYLYLQRIAGLGNRDMVRGVITQVLGQLNLTVDTLGEILVVDWDGRGMRDIRMSITRIGEPLAVVPSCPDFDTHSLWLLVVHSDGRICSAAFSLPTPSSDPDKFADFINDVIAATPYPQIQNDIIAAYQAHYAAGG